MKKRVLSLTMAFLLAFTMLPTQVAAEELPEYEGIVEEGTPEEEIHGTMVNNPEELTLLKEIVQVLNQCDGGLFSELERKVWAEWMRGYDYNEIAQRLEKTPKSIDNALQRIRKKIMVYMAEW